MDSSQIAKYHATFWDETIDYLTDLETILLELESSHDDRELINQIFRILHTIKGSAAMFGFDKISSMAHEAESVFDQIRSGQVGVDQELINLMLLVKDQIRHLLSAAMHQDPIDTSQMMVLISQLQKWMSIRNPSRMNGETGAETTVKVAYRIRFRPDKNIFFSGINPMLLIDELCSLGDCMIMAQMDAVPQLDALEPEACYIYWDMILVTHESMHTVRDVFIFVEDSADVRIHVIDEGTLDEELDYKRLGEILLEREDISAEELENALKQHLRIGQRLVCQQSVQPGIIESALKEQEYIRKLKKQRQKDLLVSSLRVSSNKLDILVNLVGELVTSQARLGRLAQWLQNQMESIEFQSETTCNSLNVEQLLNPIASAVAELPVVAEEIDRITNELRETTMQIRTVPVATLFGRYNRLIRDLSMDLGKNVAFVPMGGETELDKTVIDQLADPLMHLIRNSVSHGIEPPDQRELNGKPAQGTLVLEAKHTGTMVEIRVSDDGRGMDPDVIRSKALEKRLLKPNQILDEKELIDLVFHPGFSTSPEVSDVSGRGVGLDVVKRAIETIQGSIDIETRKGQGTTILLKLPLTLAIIDGLLIKSGDEYFVIPLSVVEECIEMDKHQSTLVRFRNMIQYRGRPLTYLNLRWLFNIPGDIPDSERIVIVRGDDQVFGIGVDRVVGQQQTVIKPLGRICRQIPGISGATILGSGHVALILDINQILHLQSAMDDEFRSQQTSP